MTLINQVRIVGIILTIEGILLFLGFDIGGSRSFVEATPKSASFFLTLGFAVLFFSKWLKK
ncbi:MAG: hypothetical protein RBR54_04555 [Sulfurimonas sp.]|jgi:hypothetical protein|nr:hypothetical protein [Sulfurimonas sp.]